jgi:membrane protease subunit HflC
MNNSTVKKLLIIGLTIVIVGLLVLFNLPYYVLEPGYTALHMRLGAFKTAQTEAGAYAKLPLIDSVIYINNRIQKSVIETNALSKDLQTISIGVAINYRICDAIALYKSVGLDFERVIINPLRKNQ